MQRTRSPKPADARGRGPLARRVPAPAAALAPLAALWTHLCLAGPALGQGAGGGWDTTISTLQGLVGVCGGIGLLLGFGVLGTASASANQRALGLTILGGSAGGLLIGYMASDLAAFITQWI